jgi:hypothetical protein
MSWIIYSCGYQTYLIHIWIQSILNPLILPCCQYLVQYLKCHFNPCIMDYSNLWIQSILNPSGWCFVVHTWVLPKSIFVSFVDLSSLLILWTYWLCQFCELVMDLSILTWNGLSISVNSMDLWWTYQF